MPHTHTHYDRGRYLLLSMAEKGLTEMVSINQHFSLSNTHLSPITSLFSPSSSKTGKNKILLACPSTQYHMAKPKKVEYPLFSTLWGSASNLSPLTFAQVNLSNWNSIHLCWGLLPMWTEFSPVEYTALSILTWRLQEIDNIYKKYSR